MFVPLCLQLITASPRLAPEHIAMRLTASLHCFSHLTVQLNYPVAAQDSRISEEKTRASVFLKVAPVNCTVKTKLRPLLDRVYF